MVELLLFKDCSDMMSFPANSSFIGLFRGYSTTNLDSYYSLKIVHTQIHFRPTLSTVFMHVILINHDCVEKCSGVYTKVTVKILFIHKIKNLENLYDICF